MRHCLALDLKDDPQLIAEYERYHAPGGVWPEILNNLKKHGVLQLEIYRTGNRLFMILETSEDVTFDKKAAADNLDPLVQEWEQLMWKFQQPLPGAAEGEKWILMRKIFDFN